VREAEAEAKAAAEAKAVAIAKAALSKKSEGLTLANMPKVEPTVGEPTDDDEKIVWDAPIPMPKTIVTKTTGSVVKVTLEPLVMRSIGGFSGLKREKWFNVHEEPFNQIEWRSQDTKQFGKSGYNAKLGRGFTISGAMMKTKEDDARPGYVDPESLMNFCGKTCPVGPDKPDFKKRCRTSGWDITHSVDFVYSSKPDNFFESGCHNPPHKKPGFVPTTPDAAADFFSQYFKYCLLPGAESHESAIIEVMNEVEAHLFDCTGSWKMEGVMQVVNINVAIAERLHSGKYCIIAY
jgi:hypothetical protein